jgi:hypothetical protein
MSNVTSMRSILISIAVLLAAAPPATAATPSTLHLNAFVYDAHWSKGRVFASKERLFQAGKLVGEDFSSCTTSKTIARCVGEYKLRRGTLRISGAVPASSNNNRLRLKGLTGIYEGARGTVLTEYNKAGTQATETLTFR